MPKVTPKLARAVVHRETIRGTIDQVVHQMLDGKALGEAEHSIGAGVLANMMICTNVLVNRVTKEPILGITEDDILLQRSPSPKRVYVQELNAVLKELVESEGSNDILGIEGLGLYEFELFREPKSGAPRGLALLQKGTLMKMDAQEYGKKGASLVSRYGKKLTRRERDINPRSDAIKTIVDALRSSADNMARALEGCVGPWADREAAVAVREKELLREVERRKAELDAREEALKEREQKSLQYKEDPVVRLVSRKEG